MSTADLRVDPTRVDMLRGFTGVYVRARSGDRWDSYDIAELDAESLLGWMHDKRPNGCNPVAENLVLIMLSHRSRHADLIGGDGDAHS